MASGIFAILDDIAALMDDVAVASKIATQKTAGILGDDLAVNAEKATGFLSSRELPVLWKITKGSFVNKIIIIPIVFLLQIFLPITITIALIIGGFYLAYEGIEKIVEWLSHKNIKNKEVVEELLQHDMQAENTKIKSAISTDFILSIEIVIIALSTVMGKSLAIQIISVSLVAILATIGVYGIVALIVRMDDAGFKLIKRSNNQGFWGKLGQLLVRALPIIIKALSVIGTIALLLVSGGIFSHNISWLHHFSSFLPDMATELILGIAGGLLAVACVYIFKMLTKQLRK